MFTVQKEFDTTGARLERTLAVILEPDQVFAIAAKTKQTGTSEPMDATIALLEDL